MSTAPDGAGASTGNVQLHTGTTSGTRGKIQVTDGTEGVSGQSLISVDTLGSVHFGVPAVATALASDPTDCAANTYATTIAANGNLTCASITNASTTAASTNTASTIVLRDSSGNFTAGTITSALTGNASTASALAANPTDCASDTYATTIAASGNLTCATVTNAGLAGSIAASKLVGSDIATVGTISSGTWSATTIALNKGGTGQTTKAAAFDALSPMSTGGDLIYGGASGTGTRLPNGTAGNTLSSAGGTSAPTWSALNLAGGANYVSGVLPNANTTATDANTASTIVARDGSGNFTAGTVTATHTGRVNSTQVVETVVAGGTCSTTYTVDPTTGTMFNVTLNGACSFAVTNLAAGHSFTIKITQSATTSPTFTSAYKWASATAPTWSASATKYDIVACVSLDGSTLDCSAVIDVR